MTCSYLIICHKCWDVFENHHDKLSIFVCSTKRHSLDTQFSLGDHFLHFLDSSSRFECYSYDPLPLSEQLRDAGDVVRFQVMQKALQHFLVVVSDRFHRTKVASEVLILL